MRVAGRDLVDPFSSFWNQFKADIPISRTHIGTGHSSVFGAQGLDLSAPDTPAWVSLPNDDLAYHVAHELTHIAMRQQGFPYTGRGSRYPVESAEARIGSDIEEMVLHPALEELLRPFGFQRSFIQTELVHAALEGLTNSPIPRQGTPWFFNWAIRYCEIRLELSVVEWSKLEIVYEARTPAICELCMELFAIMSEVGSGTPSRQSAQ